MDLPSSRELELEALLRRRDAQVTELSDEVAHLRHYLSIQPGPSTTDPVSLPPALVSLLLPHLGGSAPDGGSSSTVAAALTQRTKLLQEENDELYELLRSTETGKLKEEVKGLRRAVGRLETALRESHQVIRSLSDELDKSYEVVLPASRPHPAAHSTSHAHAHSSRKTRQPPPHLPASNGSGSGSGNGNGNGSAKPVPTAPRAHKKPRLSDARASPSSTSASLPRIQTGGGARSTSRHMDSPEHSPLLSPDSRRRDEMAVDEPPPPRGGGRGRDKERERDRDRTSRRNGGGHGGGRKGRRYSGGDRTLAERMGL